MFKRDQKVLKEQIDKLIGEAAGLISVAGDAVMQANDKTSSEVAAQQLLAHALMIVKLAKNIAVQHKIELHFLGHTLRYPQDCAAGYQFNDPYFVPGYFDGIEPRFLPDSVWLSSENCSDQGLGMFNSYDDFPSRRGDYNWLSADERKSLINDQSDLSWDNNSGSDPG